MDRIEERWLTADEMLLVSTVISQAPTVGDALVRPIVAVFTALMGVVKWNVATSVDPTQWAIPKQQWLLISQQIMDRCAALGGSDAAVQAGLDWMNKGPSSCDLDELPAPVPA